MARDQERESRFQKQILFYNAHQATDEHFPDKFQYWLWSDFEPFWIGYLDHQHIFHSKLQFFLCLPVQV